VAAALDYVIAAHTQDDVAATSAGQDIVGRIAAQQVVAQAAGDVFDPDDGESARGPPAGQVHRDVAGVGGVIQQIGLPLAVDGAADELAGTEAESVFVRASGQVFHAGKGQGAGV